MDFKDEIESLERTGFPVKTLPLNSIFPLWQESDPRLSAFSRDYGFLTAYDLWEALVYYPEAREQALLQVTIDNLHILVEDAKVMTTFERTGPFGIEQFNDEGSSIDLSRCSLNNTFERGGMEETIGSDTFSRDLELDLSNFNFSPKETNREKEVLCERDEEVYPEESYSIVKYLSKGNECKVFLGKDRVFNEKVALKQYEGNCYESNDLLNSLVEDVKMMKKYSHPNIIKCFGLHSPTQLYDGIYQVNLVFEYAPGGSLSDLLRKSGRMAICEIKIVALDVLNALDYLHSKGVVFKGLNTNSVLISEFYKLGDFGLLKDIDCLMLNPWYLSPEVIEKEDFECSDDIWSFGCLLFHLYFGRRPYHHANANKTMRLVSGGYLPLDFVEGGIESELEEMLRACWRPAEKRATARDLKARTFLAE